MQKTFGKSSLSAVESGKPQDTMRFFRSLIIVACCVMCGSSFAQSAPGQNANFKGTVVDLDGSRVPNASVLVEGKERKWSLKSDENGEFEVALPADTYRFTIDRMGFRTFIVTDFAISANSEVSHDFKLELQRCWDCKGEIYGEPRVLNTAQEFLPSPTENRTLIYVLDDQNKLAPLPFEQGQTPLHSDELAKSTKVSFIELKTEHSATTLTTAPRLFPFTSSRQGTHPPFLVWLTPHRGTRRVTAVAQKGMQGFAVDSEAIIKPSIRVLARLDGDQVFVELRPRSSLIANEYAIIGDDTKRIATFRIVAGAPR